MENDVVHHEEKMCLIERQSLTILCGEYILVYNITNFTDAKKIRTLKEKKNELLR